MEKVLFVSANFFVVASAWMCVDLLFHQKGRWFHLLSAMAFFAVEVVLIELVTGLVGCLTTGAVTLSAGVIFVLTTVFWLVRRREQFTCRLSRRWLLMISVFLFVGFLFGQFAGRYGFQGTHFCTDDLIYHAPAAVYWYQAKDISASTFDYHAYKPLNAELFSLWFLLPFGQDGLVFLSGLFWMILLCAAGGVLMQNMGVERKWFGPVIFAFFCTDIVLYQATWTFTGVDLAGPTMVFSALAFLVSALPLKQKQQWWYILSAGFCAGFASGTKVPFTTVCVALSVWVFIALKGRFAIRARNLFIFAVGAALTGSYWYIRNVVLTGNPIFPGQIGPFGGPLQREVEFDSAIFGLIVNSGFDRTVIAEILRQHLDWPKGVFILSAAGYAMGLVFIFFRGQHRKTVGLLMLIAGVMLITYPNMPFSGRNIGPNTRLEISLRFAIGLFVTGLILFSLGLNSNDKIRWLVYGVYLLGVGFAFWATPNAIKILAGTAGVLWLICFQFYRKPVPLILSSPFVALPVIAGGLLGMAVVFSFQQAKTDQRLFTTRITSLNLGNCWQKIEDLPPGSKVAVFGNMAYCYYPYFGRQFQLCPMLLQPDSKPFELPHERWLNDPAGTVWWPKAFVVDSKTWMEMLLQAETEYVVFQKTSPESWPSYYEFLQQSNIAHRIDEKDNWVLWELKR